MVRSVDEIRELLKRVKYPGFSRDIVSFGLIKEIEVKGSKVLVQLALSTNEPKIPAQIREEVTQVLEAQEGIDMAEVKVDIQAPVQPTGAVGPQKIDGITHIIAVASGKGGVGKSTVAANLAIALQRQGAAVGLCDCDLYGPSIAMMFGSQERPMADEGNRIIPIDRYGVRLMSMGFLLDEHSPAVLRGPMVTRYTQQFLRQVAWGTLDYLIVDLPPGTGDIQLTVVQSVALSGAIVVTTPQEVALIDARKATTMFHKTNVPVLGLVENMSYFVTPDTGQRIPIFGEGGGKREAERLGVPLLAQVPIESVVREGGDLGRPVARFAGDSASAQAFTQLAEQVQGMLTLEKQVA